MMHGLSRILLVVLSCLSTVFQLHGQSCNESCHNGSPRFKVASPELDKEVHRFDYVEMDCDAENYCQIEWLKDGRLSYPFDFLSGSTKGHVTLVPCNNTLKFLNSQKDATGNYTCIVSNNETEIRRTFQITVLDKPFEEKPFSIEVPGLENCTARQARPGEDVYFYCEFCAGDKADATDLGWYRRDDQSGELVPIAELTSSAGEEEDTQYIESTKKFAKNCLKENDKPTSVGRSLLIKHVTSDAFGSYVLAANYTLRGKLMTGSTKDLTLSLAPVMPIGGTIAIVVSLFGLFIFVTMVTLVCYNHHLTLQLYWKNRFGKIEERDGFQYDAFISYSDSSADCSFAITLTQLLHRHDYQVWVRDIHSIPSETLIAEEIESMRRSRRCILIISPEYLTSPHSQILTDLAADQTLRQEIKIIPILYRDVGKVHMIGHQRLVEIVRVLPCITWKESEEGVASTQDTPPSNEGLATTRGISSNTGVVNSPDTLTNGCVASTRDTPSNRGVMGLSEMTGNNGVRSKISQRPCCNSDGTQGLQNERGTLDRRCLNGLEVESYPRNGACDMQVRQIGPEGDYFPRDERGNERDDEMALIRDEEDRDGNTMRPLENMREQERQKKAKRKREKLEKKLLLKMPPKRLHAPNPESLVV